MTAQGYKKMPNGERVSPPVELQMAWLLDWQGNTFGLDFKMLLKASQALRIYRVFQKLGRKGGQEQMTQEDWDIVRNVLAVTEGWG